MKDLLSLRERETWGRCVFNSDSLIKRMGMLNHDHHTGFDPDNDGISPVYCCKYCLIWNKEHILALANEEGILALHDTNALHPSRLTVKQAHWNAIFDVAWMENETKLVTVSGDQSAVLWDVRSSDICKIANFLGHSASVKTTAFRPNQNDVFATGARDGKIMIWDIRLSHKSDANKPDNYIENAHGLTSNFEGLTSSKKKKSASVPPNSIISMVFQDENTLISCGAVDGVIKAWDIRKNYSVYKRVPMPRSRIPEKGPGFPNGFTCLVLDPSRTRLYANCLDSSIYCFNVASFDSKPVSLYRGHSNYSFYVKICMSPDGRYLLSGSSDGKAFIWNTTKSHQAPIACLEGHSGEVTSVEWSRMAEPEFVTCSDDMTYGIWRVLNETVEEDIRSKLVWVAEKEVQEVKNTEENKDYPVRTNLTGEKAVVEDSIAPSTPQNIRNWICVQERTPGTENDTQFTSLHTPRSNGNKSTRRIGSENGRKGSKRRLEDLMNKSEIMMDENRTSTEERQILTSNGEVGAKRCPNSSLPLTPRDRSRIPTSVTSPLTIHSPTEGLPNYVIDGISPHRHNCSSVARLKENVDWLTKLSKEIKVKANERYERLEESVSPTEGASKKKHRRKVSFERQTKLSSPGNLLQFFQSSVCDNVPE